MNRLMEKAARPLFRFHWGQMNSDQILEQLLILPTARAVPASPPFSTIVVLAGVEIATMQTTTERAMRSTWRERRSTGATPLLVLSDDSHRAGSVLALGVLDANGPVRSVEGVALLEVLRSISSRPRLEATRELTAELERLDQAGIPGLKVRDLLTIHTLDVRLRRDSSRWQRLSESVQEIPRSADWRETFNKLGYSIEQRRQRGHLLRFHGRPIAVVHPKRDSSEFSRLNEEGRPPEGVLINDALEEGAAFGVLASSGRLRLFHADPGAGAAVAQYLELDTGTLQVDDRAFLGLLGPEFLAEGGFDQIRTEARQFGSALRQRLDETIRQAVLPALGRALGRWAKSNGRDLNDESVRADLEHAALTFVFRALFLFYAESSNHLPMENRSYRQASLQALVEEAAETLSSLSPRSTSLWDRFQLLVKAMRSGNPAWAVPAYNGALFSSEGFVGGAILEAVELPDPDFARVLIGLGRDPLTGAGTDYSTLEIGHLGHIYEGLLSLRLSLAPQDLQYDVREDAYVPADEEDSPDVKSGDLLWMAHEGGRKSGGVYYTRSELVRHLVRQAVVPAFEKHLEHVKKLAAENPAEAAKQLFDFAVLDPACGSAHFLVNVVNELADLTTRFLATTPLPKVAEVLDRLRAGASPGALIEDVALIRRLVLKRCVFGVDISPMGAEVAKISLWLASFVPGLSLAYLDRNIVVGNSLIGVVRLEALRPPGAETQAWLLETAISEGIKKASEAVLAVAESDDRTPDEIDRSKDADEVAKNATYSMEKLFDLWTAEAFGLKGARQEVELHGPEILNGRANDLIRKAHEVAIDNHFLHWSLAFPTVFSKAIPGFDAVIGNPPWEEVTVEELGFYARFIPGARGLPQAERASAIKTLLVSRPELIQRYSSSLEEARRQRSYFSASGEYASLAGDPDLYKYFCQRYESLLREGGRLGVVLPRSAFVAMGSRGFRKWMFEQNTCLRIDFLLNSGRWGFDSEPRYTFALVAAERKAPGKGHVVQIAGTADSLQQWHRQESTPAINLTAEAFGPSWTVPLLRSQEEASLLAKIRKGMPFPLGSSKRWQCFPVAELHETNDRRLWESASTGWPLWKGESFEQYDPHGAQSRWCPDNEAVRRKVQKPRAGAGSLLAEIVPLANRRSAVLNEIGKSRVAFRDVSRATDSRTVRACLVPPETFLTNKAPYLAFVEGGNRERAACLGIMNSLPFDWQARRFVEINLNFFILEGLTVPNLEDPAFKIIGESAAALSCVDDRFLEFAESVGVQAGPLDEPERMRLRVEIDALVARAWQLNPEDLEVILSDFSLDAVTEDYRTGLKKRFAEIL